MFIRARRLPSLARAFRAGRTGAAAIEFALVAPVFLAIVFAIMGIAVEYLYEEQVDFATQKAGEALRTGGVQAQNMSEATFVSTILCPNFSIPVDCSKLKVNLTYSWGVGSGSFDTNNLHWCPAPPYYPQVLQVALPVPLILPFWAGTSLADASRYFVGAAAFATDPYGIAYSPPANC